MNHTFTRQYCELQIVGQPAGSRRLDGMLAIEASRQVMWQEVLRQELARIFERQRSLARSTQAVALSTTVAGAAARCLLLSSCTLPVKEACSWARRRWSGCPCDAKSSCGKSTMGTVPRLCLAAARLRGKSVAEASATALP